MRGPKRGCRGMGVLREGEGAWGPKRGGRGMGS